MFENSIGIPRGQFLVIGIFMKQTPGAVLIFVDDSPKHEHWFPKSKIKEGSLNYQDKEMPDLICDDLEEDDEVSFTVPHWLARREGLIS